MRLVGKILDVKEVSKSHKPPHKYRLRLKIIHSIPPDVLHKKQNKYAVITRDLWHRPSAGEKIILTETESKSVLKTLWFKDKLVTDRPVIENPSRISYTLYAGRKVIYKGNESSPPINMLKDLKKPATLKLKYGRKTLDTAIYLPPSLDTVKVKHEDFVFIKNPSLILVVSPSFGGRIVNIRYGNQKSPWQQDRFYDFENNNYVPFGIGPATKTDSFFIEPFKTIPDENPLSWVGSYTRNKKNLFLRYSLHTHLPVFTIELNTPDRWEDADLHIEFDLPWVPDNQMEFIFLTDNGAIKLLEYPRMRYVRRIEIPESLDKPFVIKSEGIFLMTHSNQPNIKGLFYRSYGTTIRFSFPQEDRTEGQNIRLTVALGNDCLIKKNNVLLVVSQDMLLGSGALVKEIGHRLRKTPFSVVTKSKINEKEWESLRR